MSSTTYKVEIERKALKEIKALGADVQVRIMKAINTLTHTPRPVGAVKLQEIDGYRMRVGDFRIIYRVNDGALLVLVVRVGHRKNAYRDVKGL